MMVSVNEHLFWNITTPQMREVALKIAGTNLAKTHRLAGGTALALHLGHRLSEDLDFFPEKCTGSVSNSVICDVLHSVSSNPQVVINRPTEVTAFIDEVKVSFVGYPYEWTKAPIGSQGLNVADVIDIVGMKAYALNRRATVRDYVDLRFAIASGISLKEIICSCESRFVLQGEHHFSRVLFLRQLTYADDLAPEEADAILSELAEGGVTFDSVMDDLCGYVAEYTRDQLR